MLHETRACGGDRGGGQMTAQDFARAMLDKALGFLLKQCQVRRDPRSFPLVGQASILISYLRPI